MITQLKINITNIMYERQVPPLCVHVLFGQLENSTLLFGQLENSTLVWHCFDQPANNGLRLVHRSGAAYAALFYSIESPIRKTYLQCFILIIKFSVNYGKILHIFCVRFKKSRG